MAQSIEKKSESSLRCGPKIFLYNWLCLSHKPMLLVDQCSWDIICIIAGDNLLPQDIQLIWIKFWSGCISLHWMLWSFVSMAASFLCTTVVSHNCWAVTYIVLWSEFIVCVFITFFPCYQILTDVKSQNKCQSMGVVGGKACVFVSVNAHAWVSMLFLPNHG